MWHQPCQCYKHTTSVDIQKHAIKAIHSCRITCERSEPARERRIVLYKSDQQQHQQDLQRWCCLQVSDWKRRRCLQVSDWQRRCCLQVSHWQRRCCLQVSDWQRRRCLQVSNTKVVSTATGRWHTKVVCTATGRWLTKVVSQATGRWDTKVVCTTTGKRHTEVRFCLQLHLRNFQRQCCLLFNDLQRWCCPAAW